MKRLKNIELEVYSFNIDLDVEPFPDVFEGQSLPTYDLQINNGSVNYLLPESIYKEFKEHFINNPLSSLFTLDCLRRGRFAIITAYIVP